MNTFFKLLKLLWTRRDMQRIFQQQGLSYEPPELRKLYSGKLKTG